MAVHVGSSHQASNLMIFIPQPQPLSLGIIIVGEVDGIIGQPIAGGRFLLTLHHFLKVAFHSHFLHVLHFFGHLPTFVLSLQNLNPLLLQFPLPPYTFFLSLLVVVRGVVLLESLES